MWRWVVGAVAGGALLLAMSSKPDEDSLVYLGVRFQVASEKTYWKYTFTYGGELYQALDFPNRTEAIYGAQTMIETLKGGA